MGILAWSQLKFRPARLSALLVGLLLATSAFTVLTAASRTSQLEATGTVTNHFVPAYEILVRPDGARTKLESRTDTVQPNFLSGIYGGITMAQYRQISRIPGVAVAAPIAMVGYALLYAPITYKVAPSRFAEPGRELFRVSTTWSSDAGTSHVTQPGSYLYVTPNKLAFDSSSGAMNEVLPSRAQVGVCPFVPLTIQQNPFGVAAQSNVECWSKSNGVPPPFATGAPEPAIAVDWVVPVLIAAIDPEAEAKLDGLNHALTSGKYLGEGDGDTALRNGTSTFPVLASSNVGMDETAVTELQLMPSPDSPQVMNLSWLNKENPETGRILTTYKTTANQAYQALLRYMDNKEGLPSTLPGYWSVGPVTYRQSAGGVLIPKEVKNAASVWYTAGFNDVSLDDEDNQYRTVESHTHGSNQYSMSAGRIATPRLIGTFNPDKIEAFDQLSQVPLGAYLPIAASPDTETTKQALHGSDLEPNENLGGYVGQPVDLVTTLSALPALQNSGHYSGDLHTSDPISVIR
ncbi:MAG: hypothetical protein WAM97_01180, partial [Acidimicrobiales bacterium]